MRGRDSHPERGRQHPPHTSAGQHIDDRGEHGSLIGRGSAAALATWGEHRQQRLDHLPRLIGTKRNDSLSVMTEHHARQPIPAMPRLLPKT